MIEVRCHCERLGRLPCITPVEHKMAELSGLSPEYCHAMSDLFELGYNAVEEEEINGIAQP